MSDISFNNSKITKICYHGTDSAPFTVLDKTKIQKDPDEGDAGYFGWGFYLTTDLEYAKTFGKNILKFKVNIQNPFDFNDADYDKLVEFIINDSDKKLNSHIHDTMYFLRQVGNNKKLEYKNNNSEEIRKQCLDIYHKYKNNKSFTEEEKQEIASLLAILAKDLNNWLNGLFFYFGREIFHYFTSNGFDGVIVLNGKEVVVYETKQLEPVQEEELHIVEDVKDGKLIVYRVGQVADFKQGLYFADNLEYFDYSDTGYSREQAEAYELNLKGKKVFDPITEWNLEAYTWADIRQTEEFFKEHNFTDYEYLLDIDYDNPDEYHEVMTSTEALAHYAYKQGYDAIILRDIPGGSWGPDFTEYCIFNKDMIKPASRKYLREDTKPTKSQVLNDLLDVFGEADINELSDAVYILPNGKVLDTKGDSVVSQHENISIYLEKKYNIKDISKDGGSKFMNSIGAIRVTPWIPAIVVPSIKMTEKQDDVLFSIIKHFSVKVSADKPLMISSEDGKQYIEYTKIDNPEEVITAILGYQILGILKEKLAPGKEHKFLNRLN